MITHSDIRHSICGISRPNLVGTALDVRCDGHHLYMAAGRLRIGALVPNSDLAYDERVRQRYPLLSSAILAGASAQLRNMASTGGNLLQRTRCLYFYDTNTACNKREPGSGCGALEGFNRMNAILGWSKSCIAVHPSDMCVALAVLEATVHVTGPRGSRAVPFAEFHRLPGDMPEIDTNLAADEIISTARRTPDNLIAMCTHGRSGVKRWVLVA